uniref:OSJNBb0086G13.2 protein n=1 Tax=Oryza sativa subsp. japonica TaxID=39947 RepID=Q7FAJ3_ORYSJ|nr:OSJNBb0086G13.2 [Oryza sativa Japonica Group]
MANFFPMALKGQARGWLMNLPPVSVHSWEDLCQQFTMNFQGTYPRPDEEADLHAVQRRDDESLRSYIQRFCQRTRKWEEERRQERREGKAPAAPSGNRRSEAKQKAPAEDVDDDDDDLGFQEPGATIATVDGGACAHASRRSLKAMKRELLAAAPTHEATRRARWSEVALTFDQTDHPPCVARGGQIAMVVSPTVCNMKLGRVLIDGGAALNILSPAAFDAIKVPGMVLRPSQPIIGVTPGHTWPLGHIDLPVTFGGSANFRTERVNFDVADLSLPYNAMKMPGPGGPISVHGDLKVALACMEQRADHLAAASKPEGGNERLSTSVPAAPRQRMITCDEVPEDALVSFLRANADVFAWRPADMPGVPRKVIEHRLAVQTGARPVRQKVRRQAPERQAFIREEVARLLEAGFIREVIHPEWLANPIVVPKANGKLRMCIDYTDVTP